MSTDEKQGTGGPPSDSGNNAGHSGASGDGQRTSRAPVARKKRRRPSRTSRIPRPPAPDDNGREVEEQTLGPGRKKRIFKRRKKKTDKPETAAVDAGAQSAGTSDREQGQRNSNRRSRSGRTRGRDGGDDAGREARRGKRRGRNDGGTSKDGATERQNSGRRNSRSQEGKERKERREEEIAALSVRVSSAPDGAFSNDDYADLDPMAAHRNVPAYAQMDSDNVESSESFFSGRKGHDFASMTDAELDFLKPHDANEAEFYDDLPVLDFKRPQKGKLMDIVGVKTHQSGVIEPYDCEDLILARGDEVIVETDRGLAIGEVMVPTTRRWVKKEVLRVFRAATPNDMRQRDRNRQKAAEAFDLCQKSIVRLKLDMKLVEVTYLHGGNKAVFYFMAEGRVDFRQLVKDLARELHIRVEMRQIGVRDASRMIGGLGTCGLKLCCSRYIREFAPVSIRMAKDQDLVLNPEKVSGQCGRLMCCLAYEEEVYKEKGKAMPRVGKIVETPEGCGRVRDRDILRGLVRVELETEHGLKSYNVTDIRPAASTGDCGRKRRKDGGRPDNRRDESSSTDSEAPKNGGDDQPSKDSRPERDSDAAPPNDATPQSDASNNGMGNGEPSSGQ
ncbi:MAG: hypothetical protein JXR76_07405 [Deltaproteobacteria bacterium]|nr:hypothetical protein [Deltaproteobacteria bacterium]